MNYDYAIFTIITIETCDVNLALFIYLKVKAITYYITTIGIYAIIIIIVVGYGGVYEIL
jgi:hypothetical protein